MNPTLISMNHLAKAAGVHVSTVSRSLRGQQSIPEKTRRRIQELATKLGYRPDPLLGALCAYRKTVTEKRHPSTLAIIATAANWQENLASRLYCEGARSRAFELGYQTEIFVMSPSRLSGRRLAGILTTRGIRGVVVLPLADVSISFNFPWEKFLVVATGNKLKVPNINRVSVNHFSAMRDALIKIHAMGYRQPGLILRAEGERLAPNGITYVNNLWEGAYLAEGSKLFANLRIPVVQSQIGEDLKFWLRKHKPDVVISQIRDARRLIPADEFSTPIVYTMVDEDDSLTGIHQNSRFVGRHAIDLLIGGLYKEEPTANAVTVSVLVDSRWQAGTTAVPCTRIT